MKVGYLCRHSTEEISFATEAGFGSVQLLIYPGDPLDPAVSSEDEVKAARDAWGEAGIEISAVGTTPTTSIPIRRRPRPRASISWGSLM